MKEFSKHTKDRHLSSCKKKLYQIYKDQTSKIIELKLQVEKLQAQLEIYKEMALRNQGTIEEKLQAQLKIYKEMALRNQGTIEEIAKQPRVQTTNTQNNLTNLLTPMDMDKNSFAKTIQDSFTKNYFLSGQKGAARFAVDNLLKDENGKLKYICTDPSRQIYRFKSQDGGLERDVKAKKLTMALVDNLAKKSQMITADEISNGDSNMFVLYTSNFQDIKELQEDNGEFRTELAILTTVN